MFLPLLGLFAAHAALWAYSEIKCRVKGRSFPGAALAIALTGLIVRYAPYDARWPKALFAALLAAAVALTLREAARLSERWTPSERWSRPLLLMMHPLALIALGALWPFVHGVGFFVGIVLPFSTDHLEPLALAYATALAVLALYRAAGWARTRAQAARIGKALRRALPKNKVETFAQDAAPGKTQPNEPKVA